MLDAKLTLEMPSVLSEGSFRSAVAAASSVSASLRRAPGRVREATRRMADGPEVGKSRRGLGFRQDRIPSTEADVHEGWRERKVLHHAAHRRVQHHVGMHLRARRLGGFHRDGPSAFERGRRRLEVDIVRVVPDLVHHVARDHVAGEVGVVSLDRVVVRPGRIAKTTRAQVDVRRHVDDVARAGDECTSSARAPTYCLVARRSPGGAHPRRGPHRPHAGAHLPADGTVRRRDQVQRRRDQG